MRDLGTGCDLRTKFALNIKTNIIVPKTQISSEEEKSYSEEA